MRRGLLPAATSDRRPRTAKRASMPPASAVNSCKRCRQACSPCCARASGLLGDRGFEFALRARLRLPQRGRSSGCSAAATAARAPAGRRRRPAPVELAQRRLQSFQGGRPCPRSRAGASAKPARARACAKASRACATWAAWRAASAGRAPCAAPAAAGALVASRSAACAAAARPRPRQVRPAPPAGPVPRPPARAMLPARARWRHAIRPAAAPVDRLTGAAPCPPPPGARRGERGALRGGLPSSVPACAAAARAPASPCSSASTCCASRAAASAPASPAAPTARSSSAGAHGPPATRPGLPARHWRLRRPLAFRLLHPRACGLERHPRSRPPAAGDGDGCSGLPHTGQGSPARSDAASARPARPATPPPWHAARCVPRAAPPLLRSRSGLCVLVGQRPLAGSAGFAVLRQHGSALAAASSLSAAASAPAAVARAVSSAVSICRNRAPAARAGPAPVHAPWRPAPAPPARRPAHRALARAARMRQRTLQLDHLLLRRWRSGSRSRCAASAAAAARAASCRRASTSAAASTPAPRARLYHGVALALQRTTPPGHSARRARALLRVDLGAARLQGGVGGMGLGRLGQLRGRLLACCRPASPATARCVPRPRARAGRYPARAPRPAAHRAPRCFPAHAAAAVPRAGSRCARHRGAVRLPGS